MRLDKYLKVSRIIKRRSVANEACSGGRVFVNERLAKPSAEVKPGDIIAIRFGEHIGRYRVLQVKEVVRKEETSDLYELISEDEHVQSERNA
jgi:ribosomal 50S subunit-recycling heat shock protein